MTAEARQADLLEPETRDGAVLVGLVSDTAERGRSAYRKPGEIVVGLVSDTHDNLALATAAAAFFRARAPDLVLHLGDVVTGAAVGCFSGLPMRFVRGNNDDNRVLAPSLQRHGFPRLRDAWTCVLGGVRVAALHGHVKPALAAALPLHDVVVHGHTHRRRRERVDGTLVVNPGALYRTRTKSVALLRLPEKEVEFFEVTREGVRPLERAP